MLPNTALTRFRPSPHGRGEPGSRFFLIATLLATGVLAGCATGDFAMLAEIAGGEKVRVPFARGGPEMKNEDGVQITQASFTLSPEKKLRHVFVFTDRLRRPLRRVQVEDVADAAAVSLVDDAQPKPSATGEWRGEMPPVEWNDARVGWLATISNTLRVYRFTLTFADGRTQVLLQGAFYPAPLKAAVRQTVGQNY
jgi:hypothetical protein